MIDTVREAPPHYRQNVSAKVINLLTMLTTRELTKREGDLEMYQKNYTPSMYRHHAATAEPQITKLKTCLTGLDAYNQALCDFLIYRAVNSPVLDQAWTWKLGDALPKASASEAKPTRSAERVSVPAHFLCPISQELMEDPVITCDNFTFERNNIER
jgi:hypothetical protein